MPVLPGMLRPHSTHGKIPSCPLEMPHASTSQIQAFSSEVVLGKAIPVEQLVSYNQSPNHRQEHRSNNRSLQAQ